MTHEHDMWNRLRKAKSCALLYISTLRSLHHSAYTHQMLCINRKTSSEPILFVAATAEQLPQGAKNDEKK
eukprot:scaffold37999_cov214-Skeletonema_marinoi.AAC.4